MNNQSNYLIQDQNVLNKKRKFNELTNFNSKSTSLSTEMNRTYPHSNFTGFIHLPPGHDRYHAESISLSPYERNKQNETLYKPLTEYIFINTKSYEEIMVRNGAYFLTNENGVYEKTCPGVTINFLKHCTTERKMYIARSLLFLNAQDAEECLKSLQN